MLHLMIFLYCKWPQQFSRSTETDVLFFIYSCVVGIDCPGLPGCAWYWASYRWHKRACLSDLGNAIHPVSVLYIHYQQYVRLWHQRFLVSYLPGRLTLCLNFQTLADFQYIDSSGRDQGSNVRRKSQSLVSLVNDKERIQEVRQKALATRDKWV